jgi:uncharacterized metal-binding protein
MRPFIKLLKIMYNELTETAADSIILYKSVKKTKNEYLLRHPLIPEAAAALSINSASLKEILDIWLPTWKSEGRIGIAGRTIRLGKEAKILGEEPEVIMDVYDVCTRITALFCRK